MNTHNIISVSGGKDSTALLLLAIDRGVENLSGVFADTGHEHQQTYDYVRYLEHATGVPITWVRADFSDRIAVKRTYIENNWISDLTKEGDPGFWEWEAYGDDGCGPAPSINPFTGQEIEVPEAPLDLYARHVINRGFGRWVWEPSLKPLSIYEATSLVERALSILKPTGIPFLDLVLWKGRFPSTKARFCSEELKRNPIIEQVQMPLLEQGDKVISWQGVRADESESRALLAELECNGSWPDTGGELWNYRPILKWTAKECFDMHKRHGIQHNPLYEMGMGRVGCMPCIHARKDELLEISLRFPEEVARVEQWERIASLASKRGMATFFSAVGQDIVTHEKHGIWQRIEWAKTSRGGKQYDLLRSDSGSIHLCKSMYGLCE